MDLFGDVDVVRLRKLQENAKDWALCHGLCMRQPSDPERSDFGQIAPFNLFPSEFPTALFNQALAVHKDYAVLYHKLAHDPEFLRSAHANVVKTDEFTRRILEIHDIVVKEGISQPLSLNVQRSDYMTHLDPGDELPATGSSVCKTRKLQLKQVEVNSIAASFAGLDVLVNAMHRYLLAELAVPRETVDLHIPENSAPATIAQGLVRAHGMYGVPEAVVVFMVEETTMNIADQRAIEYLVRDLSGNAIAVRRVRFCDTHSLLKLKEDRRLVTTEGDQEVAVIYWRVGYIPSHYSSDADWEARLMIERSRAIKCPWIGFHLAGTKKVQQLLTRPGVVEKYLEDPAAAKRIRDTFVAIYGLADDEEGRKAVQLATERPHDYVLKPQLEGGGNNFYGDEIVSKLDSLDWEGRAAFILMERIHPVVHSAHLVRATPLTNHSASNQSRDTGHSSLIGPLDTPAVQCVSELGTYGYLIGGEAGAYRPDDLVSGGYLLRTKSWQTDEGGVMAGASVLDTPWLI